MWFTKEKEEEKKDDIERNPIILDPATANQQLIELLRKIMPENKYITPEMLVPLIVIGATLLMSKYNIDKDQVLQTVQETNNTVVTTYNQWVPLAITFLYAILGGGALSFAATATKNKEEARKETARSISNVSLLFQEQERTRGLQAQSRSLELQNEAKEKEIELQKIMAKADLAAAKADNSVESNTVPVDKYSDVSPELKS